MSNHKFKLGLSVFLERTTLNRDAAPGAYEVTRQLPERDGEFEYQIKSPGRAACARCKESELSGNDRARRYGCWPSPSAASC